MSTGHEELIQAMESRLLAEASHLAAEGEFPISLERLVHSLGVSLERSPSSAGKNGFLTRRNGKWVIHVCQSGSRSDSIGRERFTIAHELGHYFLECSFSHRPTSEADYWMIEEVCNRFAAELLVPQEYLLALAKPGSARELLGLAKRIEREALVSFQTAARCITGSLLGEDCSIAYVKIAETNAKGSWIHRSDKAKRPTRTQLVAEIRDHHLDGFFALGEEGYLEFPMRGYLGIGCLKRHGDWTHVGAIRKRTQRKKPTSAR